MESFALEKLAVELNGTPLGAKDSLLPIFKIQELATKTHCVSSEMLSSWQP